MGVFNVCAEIFEVLWVIDWGSVCRVHDKWGLFMECDFTSKVFSVVKPRCKSLGLNTIEDSNLNSE